MPFLHRSTESDDVLIQRTRAGDVDAYAELLHRELPALRAFVSMKLSAEHLVDEIAHETFVFAFRNLDAFEIGRPFRPWLRTIAWNLLRKELQRQAREQVNLSKFEQIQAELVEQEGDSPPSKKSIYLEECLRRLDGMKKFVVDEHYQIGRSPEEIARRCGRTPEWVRVTLFRIRKQLKDCIEFKLAGNRHAH